MDPSERIVLTKNPNYVGGWDNSKIVSDSITLLLLEDSSASFAAYNSGEAVLIKDVPTDEIPQPDQGQRTAATSTLTPFWAPITSA